MLPSPRHHCADGAFVPLDNLWSEILPAFDCAAMVNERQPPRPLGASTSASPQVPLIDRTNVPEFGKASPLRNPLKQKGKAGSIFNIPNHHKPRVEHHRANPNSGARVGSGSAEQSSLAAREMSTSHEGLVPRHNVAAAAQAPASTSLWPRQQGRAQVQQDTVITSSPSLVEIPKPSIFMPKPIPAAPEQILYARPSVMSQRPSQPHQDFVDLTGARDRRHFLADDHFDSFDPSNYLDASQANENIKALLEGAFEDDDDKPMQRTRRRKQGVDTAGDELARKLAGVTMADDGGSLDAGEDDGVVDGLSVRLLPHQIDGLAWMLDKEIGERKKNGVLPKGGILADDVSLITISGVPFADAS
ncbi:hypothetical protein MRB53_040543 [Persea americana]|nr:hypothetical protein MRB53_040543 [Persea americana]